MEIHVTLTSGDKFKTRLETRMKDASDRLTQYNQEMRKYVNRRSRRPAPRATALIRLIDANEKLLMKLARQIDAMIDAQKHELQIDPRNDK